MLDKDVDQIKIHGAILNGCYQLIQRKSELNKINVFPVADGDTGDNMAAVGAAIIEISAVKDNLPKTLESIAEAAIIGSRGNSGILLSQFFVGLNEHNKLTENFNILNFTNTLNKIALEIDSVLSNPVEGTIITVIKKLSELLNSQTDNNSISHSMNLIVPLLKQEVLKTSDKIAILKTAKVVDAGALGFYYFIEGFTAFLQQDKANPIINNNQIDFSTKHDHQHSELSEYRYCAEAILKKPLICKESILQKLQNTSTKESNCLGVVGSKDLLKIHLHTNDPIDFFSTINQLGTVKYPKVDDMHRQYEIQFAKKYNVALVTDSSADLPNNLLDNYQIHTVPLNINFDESQFLDKYCFEPINFYNQILNLKVYPTTSCVPSQKIKIFLNKLREQYDYVLILSLSSAMSGMFASFVEASKEDKNIVVIDTKTNSAAHGLLLNYTAQLIEKKLPFNEITKKIKKAIDNTYIFVLVNQFDAMQRSGRISKLSAKIASWSNIKPIVSINKNGNAYIAGKSISFEKGIDKLIKLVQTEITNTNCNLEDYAIVHADNIAKALQLKNASETKFNKLPLFIEHASVAVGLHAGKGCVAIAARLNKVID